MYKVFKGALMAIAVSAALAACSSGNDVPDHDPNPAAAAGARLEGAAVKGMLRNAVIEAFGIRNGVVDETPLASATIAEGAFSLALPVHYSGPIKVVVSAAPDGGSTMVCDVRPACAFGAGEVPFGGDIPLPPQFSLRSFYPDVTAGETLPLSVTPLTDMAGALLRSGDALVTSAAIRDANARVGALFHLSSITSVQPPNLADPASVAAAGEMELGYALLAAAIMDIAMQDFAGDAAAVLARLRASYVDNNGDLLGREPFGREPPAAITLYRIVESALRQLRAMEADPAYADVPTALLAGQWTLLRDFADRLGPAPTGIEPGAEAELGGMLLVKDFVRQIRGWGMHLQQEITEGGSSYPGQAAMAADFSEQAGKQLGQTLIFAAQALARAEYDGYRSSDLAYYLPAGVAGNGRLERTDGFVTVQGAIGGWQLSLRAPAAEWRDADDGQRFVLSGLAATLENDEARLEIETGELVVAVARLSATDPAATALAVEADLSLAMVQKQGQPGQALFSFNGSGYLRGAARNGRAMPQRLDFNGEFADAAGGSLTARLVAGMKNAEAYLDGGDRKPYPSVSLYYRLDRAAEPRAISVLLALDLSEADDGAIRAALSYGVHRLQVAVLRDPGSESGGTVYLYGQGGITAVLTPQQSKKGRLGGIRYNGKLYADIYWSRHGYPEVQYTDGSFESLL